MIQEKGNKLRTDRGTGWIEQFRKHVRIARSPGNLIRSGMIFLLTACIFILCRTTLFPEGSNRFFSAMPMIAVASAAMLLSLLRIKLSHRSRVLATGFTLFLLPLVCVGLTEWINESYLITRGLPLRWLANYICNLMIFTFIFTLCRRISLTAAIGTGICFGFGIATYYTIQFRGIPVLPWDLKSLNTAAAVIGTYEFEITYPIAMSFLIVAAMLAFLRLIKPEEREQTRRTRMLERVVSGGICLALIILLFPVNILPALSVNVWPWNQKASTMMTGVSAGFIGNLQFVMVDKPDNYSPEQAAAVAGAVTAVEVSTGTGSGTEAQSMMLGSPDEKPTIIAIMNESFADLDQTAEGSLALSEDPLPFIHALMDSGNTYSGTAYSSVTGGSTCDSEFEFLTANSMHFLPVGSKPYQQYITSEQTSIVSTLEASGYDSVAIHPGKRSAWNRDKVYPQLGFDRFIAAQDFTEERELLRGYTNDASCYKQLIAEYEAQKIKENPLFIFNVTIQNHGGFEEPDFPSEIEIQSAAVTDREAKAQTEQYLTLIKRSDQDFEELIRYFENEDEPVVLVFFGDHWPALEPEIIETILDVEDALELTAEETMRQYEVPFFIWANYPLETASNQITSLNQLSGYLLRAAGIEPTPFQQYVQEFSEQIPVLTGIGMLDASGTAYLSGEDTPYEELLNDYQILQYNQLFDEDEKIERLFKPQ